MSALLRSDLPGPAPPGGKVMEKRQIRYKQESKQAGKIREGFDTYVMGLPWNARVPMLRSSLLFFFGWFARAAREWAELWPLVNWNAVVER